MNVISGRKESLPASLSMVAPPPPHPPNFDLAFFRPSDDVQASKNHPESGVTSGKARDLDVDLDWQRLRMGDAVLNQDGVWIYGG